MTNEEKWSITLKKVAVNNRLNFGVLKNGKSPASCGDLDCSECMFYVHYGDCRKPAKRWAKEEYKNGN